MTDLIDKNELLNNPELEDVKKIKEGNTLKCFELLKNGSNDVKSGAKNLWDGAKKVCSYIKDKYKDSPFGKITNGSAKVIAGIVTLPVELGYVGAKAGVKTSKKAIKIGVKTADTKLKSIDYNSKKVRAKKELAKVKGYKEKVAEYKEKISKLETGEYKSRKLDSLRNQINTLNTRIAENKNGLKFAIHVSEYKGELPQNFGSELNHFSAKRAELEAELEKLNGQLEKLQGELQQNTTKISNKYKTKLNKAKTKITEKNNLISKLLNKAGDLHQKLRKN